MNEAALVGIATIVALIGLSWLGYWWSHLAVERAERRRHHLWVRHLLRDLVAAVDLHLASGGDYAELRRAANAARDETTR